MKKLTAVAVLGSVILMTGCVPVTYTKSVTVHKDANGKITEIEEYESITEPHSEMKKIKEIEATPFEHLK